MTVDDRLRDLRQATADQLHPSPRLRHRIEATVDAPRRSRPVIVIAASLAAAAAVVALFAMLPVGRDTDQHVLTRSPTREEFVTAANRRCLAYRAEHDRVVPTFLTPEAFTLAADNRTMIIRRAIIDAETLGAPPDAQDVLGSALRHLQEGLDRAGETRRRAEAGDVGGAAAAFQAEEDAVDQAAAALAVYGARGCRPATGP